jgi:hypothetical protein
MNKYLPDNWVVLKITHEGKTLYKVLAGWMGGYLDGDSWRMNSGITKAKIGGNNVIFYGSSGSCYVCRKGVYRLSMATSGVYNELKERFGDAVQLMSEDTEWMDLDYE